MLYNICIMKNPFSKDLFRKFLFFFVVIICFQYIYTTLGTTFHLPIYYFLLNLPLNEVFWVNILYTVGLSALLALTFSIATKNIWLGYLAGIIFLFIGGKVGWNLGFLKDDVGIRAFTFGVTHLVLFIFAIPVIYFLNKFFNKLSIRTKNLALLAIIIISLLGVTKSAFYCSQLEPYCQAWAAYRQNDVSLCSKNIASSPYFLTPMEAACRTALAQKTNERSLCIPYKFVGPWTPWISSNPPEPGNYRMDPRSSYFSSPRTCLEFTSPDKIADKQILENAYQLSRGTFSDKAKNYSFDPNTNVITYSRQQFNMEDLGLGFEHSEERYLLEICYEENNGDVASTLSCFMKNSPNKWGLFYNYLGALGYK